MIVLIARQTVFHSDTMLCIGTVEHRRLTPPEATATPEFNHRRRRSVLAVCCLSIFVVGLDNTIVNLALPAIGSELHATASRLQWTIDAYQLALAALMLLAGSTADRFGRRRIFQLGLGVFALASLLCGMAPGIGWLIAFRALQGLGASMLNPVAMSIVRNTFADPRERARAFGTWSGVYGASMAVGPIVGGSLIQAAGWRSIFWINIPIGIAAIALTARYVPESRAARSRRFDPAGQLLVIALLAFLTFAIIQAPEKGWGGVPILSALVIASLALAGLLLYEPRRGDPLIELSFFRSVPFSGAMAIALCALAATGGFLFVNTLYLQDVRGYSPLTAGLCTLPTALATLLLAPVSGRWTATRGSRPPLVTAGVAMAAAGLVLTTTDGHTPLTVLMLAYSLFGLGFAMVNAPVTSTAVAGMPASRAGVASAIASTGRQAGQALGVAVIGAVATSEAAGTPATALPAANHAGWWVVAGCGTVVALLAVLTTTRWAQTTAAATAARFASEDRDPTAGAPIPFRISESLPG